MSPVTVLLPITFIVIVVGVIAFVLMNIKRRDDRRRAQIRAARHHDRGIAPPNARIGRGAVRRLDL